MNASNRQSWAATSERRDKLSHKSQTCRRTASAIAVTERAREPVCCEAADATRASPGSVANGLGGRSCVRLVAWHAEYRQWA